MLMLVAKVNLALQIYVELGPYVEKRRLSMTNAIEIVKLDFVLTLKEMKSGAILDMRNFCYAPCTTLQAFYYAPDLPLLLFF